MPSFSLARNRRPLRLESLEERRLLALVPELVADLNTRGVGSDAQVGVTIGDDLYFLAERTDLANFYDVWRYQGDGSVPVNLTHGSVNVRADEAGLAAIGDRVVFRGFAEGYPMSLWSSEGSANGTIPIHEAAFEPTGSPFVPFRGELYYVGSDENGEPWLKRTNGQPEGTSLVTALPAAIDSRTLSVAGDQLFFFTGNSTSNYALWATDGTSVGTRQVMGTDFGAAWFWSNRLVALGDYVYFAGDDATHGQELWRTNGQVTEIVDDQHGPADGLADRNLIVEGNYVYVTTYAASAQQGRKLMRTHGESLAAIATLEREVTQVQGEDDKFYFVSGPHLWVSDGTPDGAINLFGSTDAGGPAVKALEVLDDEAYFAVHYSNSPQTSLSRNELWKSDGTSGGATLLKTFQPGSADSGPHGFLHGDSRLFFTADTAAHGEEIWEVSGATDIPRLVLDANPRTESAESWYLTPTEDALYFLAENGSDLGIWSMSVGSNEPVRLGDFAAGWSNGCHSFEIAHPDSFLEPADDLVYLAPGFGRYLARTDGTVEGTRTLYDFAKFDHAGADRRLMEMVGVGDRLLFDGYDDVRGRRPWVSDGTPEGTHVLLENVSSLNSTEPWRFTRLGDYVYFFAFGQIGEHFGQAIWRTDGTSEGTSIAVALPQSLQVSNRNDHFATVDGVMYFVATTNENGREIWRTDGTQEGTYLLKDITPGASSSSLAQLVAAGPFLYFEAQNELWRSDGTAEGTVKCAPLRDIRSIVHLGATTFVSRGAIQSQEIWRTDGTPEGTVKLDFGSEFGNLSQLLPVPGGFAFVGRYDSTGLKQLWISNGTVESTRPFLDAQYNLAIPTSASLPAWNGSYYLQADVDDAGLELVRISPIPGDTNFDGQVDLTDLNNVRNHFGETGNVLGDSNGDGVVDLEDLNAVRNNFGAGGASSSVVARGVMRPGKETDGRRTLPRDPSLAWQDALFVSESTTTTQRFTTRKLKALDRVFASL